MIVILLDRIIEVQCL